jgi:AcrR family transcriptional regulator
MDIINEMLCFLCTETTLIADMVSSRKSVSKPQRSFGRPRSELARTSILNAAYSFLETQPVSSISPLHIARKAGVSTATVYRWWPTKETLLLDAFLCKTEQELILSSTGSPLECLRQYLLQLGRFLMGSNGIVVARLLTAIQDNPALRDEFLERVHSPRSKAMRSTVREAIRAGQLPAKTNVSDFLDMLFGPILLRLLIRHEPIRESFVISVFDHAVSSTRSLAAHHK